MDCEPGHCGVFPIIPLGQTRALVRLFLVDRFLLISDPQLDSGAMRGAFAGC